MLTPSPTCSSEEPAPAVVRAALAVDLLALDLVDDVAVVPAQLRARPDVLEREETHPWKPMWGKWQIISNYKDLYE